MTVPTTSDNHPSPDEGLSAALSPEVTAVLAQFFVSTLKRLHERAKKQAGLTAGSSVTATVQVNGIRVTLGTVTASNPTPEPDIFDEQACADWALTHYPHEVIVVPEHRTLRETFVKMCSVTVSGVPLGPNGEVGVPGLRAAQGQPVVSTRPVYANVAEILEVLPDVRNQVLELLADEVFA
jgi:hypothetical protein